jgi:N-methylhydantoinase B
MLKPLKANNIALNAGDTVTINTGGGGGFGNPWERDIELVRRDVLDGYVTREGAERDYGVAFTADGLEVDIEATRRLRTELSSSWHILNKP